MGLAGRRWLRSPSSKRTGSSFEFWNGIPTNRRRAAPRSLAVAPPKGDRFKWLIEKATELGVDQITPLITTRTVVEPGSGKLDKLQAAVVAACKQSGRNRVMQVHENLPFGKLIEIAGPGRIVLVGDPGDGCLTPP